MHKDKLAQATLELRESTIRLDALSRGERAIFNHVKRAPKWRPVMLWATGIGAVAALGILMLMPYKASAADVLRIVGNADRGFRHMQIYTVQPDGSFKLQFDTYAENGRRRWSDAQGFEFVYDGNVLAQHYKDGTVTLERQPPSPVLPPEEGSAHNLIVAKASGINAHLTVEKGFGRGSTVVDRYTIDNDSFAPGGKALHSHIVLDADARSDRPLEMHDLETGFPERVTRWDYPIPSPAVFRVSVAPGTPVYDISAERASVLAALKEPGSPKAIGGVPVELVQLWVDDMGTACAIARADYAYPEDFSIRIDDVAPSEQVASDQREDKPFSGRYAIVQPTDGVQLFFFEAAKPVHYSDRVTLQIPIFGGKKLLGFARFDDVPVHRAYNAIQLLRPTNVPFWAPPVPVELTPAKPASQ